MSQIINEYDKKYTIGKNRDICKQSDARGCPMAIFRPCNPEIHF